MMQFSYGLHFLLPVPIDDNNKKEKKFRGREEQGGPLQLFFGSAHAYSLEGQFHFFNGSSSAREKSELANGDGPAAKMFCGGGPPPKGV